VRTITEITLLFTVTVTVSKNIVLTFLSIAATPKVKASIIVNWLSCGERKIGWCSVVVPPEVVLLTLTSYSIMVGPSSIRSSTTSATQFDHPFGPHITITRKDLSSSTLAYQRLLSASKSYTNSTLSLANSSSELASALDECSRLKGSHESSSQLQALSGLYYLISSYNQVLADSFWKDFSIPLLNHFDVYNAANFERSLTNEKLLAEKSKVLKDTEMRNLKNGRKKERDLNSFRKALNELQEQVEEIDRLKSDYYHELLQSEEECWKLVMEKVSLFADDRGSNVGARVGDGSHSFDKPLRLLA